MRRACTELLSISLLDAGGYARSRHVRVSAFGVKKRWGIRPCKFGMLISLIPLRLAKEGPVPDMRTIRPKPRQQ